MYENRIAVIKRENMFIDYDYQQPPRSAHIRRMRKNGFDAKALGVLTISKRNYGDHIGKFAVVDGQHRLLAFELNSYPCIIHYNLSLEEESALFSELNGVKIIPSTNTLFFSQLLSKDKTAVAINEAVLKAGIKINKHQYPTTNSIGGVASLIEIEKMGGAELITESLLLLRNSFINGNSSREIYNASLIVGFARFIKNFGETINHKHLASVLGKFSPHAFLNYVRNDMAERGLAPTVNARPRNVVGVLVMLYNSGKHKHKRLELKEKALA